MNKQSQGKAVSISDLRCSFGHKLVLDGISLDIEHGEIVAIMGSSGGGKTTLLRCVSGLVSPSSGTIVVEGVDSLRDPELARRSLGMVFQSAALFDFMSVEDNVHFGLKRWSKEKPLAQEARVRLALGLVGLGDSGDLMPSELSGGMKKRVGIARALAIEPKVMLYDEPTTGLDPITTYAIDKLIVDLRNTLGMTSIVVSHDVSSVFRVADRIAFLHEGKLTFVGSTKEFEQSRDAAIRELVQKAEATTLNA